MRAVVRRLGLALAILVAGTVFAQEAKAQSCVFWVRQLTDIEIRGDAWRWWDNAAGTYERSSRPAVGSVLVFRRASGLRQGHVSTVSRVVDRRTIEVDHSWLADNRLYRGMRVVDVSPRNDWTRVRVWHPGIDELGTTAYSTFGFVHPHQPRPDLLQARILETAPTRDERRRTLASLSDDGDRLGRRATATLRREQPAPVAVAPRGRSVPIPEPRPAAEQVGALAVVPQAAPAARFQPVSLPARKPAPPSADVAAAPGVELPVPNPRRARSTDRAEQVAALMAVHAPLPGLRTDGHPPGH
jgi:hypothetical protein